MRQLIILPGNSARNKEWGEAVAAEYGQLFDQVYAQDYQHWREGRPTLDFAVELASLRKFVSAAGPDTEFYVFAKSAGTLLTLLAAKERLLVPQGCVFFGLPLDWAEHDVFKGDWSPLADFTVPTLAFHNDHDPIADCDFVKDVLANHASLIRLVVTKGDTHDYLDFPEYRTALHEFFKSTFYELYLAFR